tara:strand:+ start:10340 stop:10822 length:483 start_codon:yes stop_codon:yes gene_type:complete
MNASLCFKAQSLDNTSPDHYQIGTDLLTDNDTIRRQEIADKIADIMRQRSFPLKSNGAELILYRRKFLAQVHAVQTDEAERRAPIICIGEFDQKRASRADVQCVIQALEDFAAKINRTIEPEHIKFLGSAFEQVNPARSVWPWILAIGLILSLILLTLYL